MEQPKRENYASDVEFQLAYMTWRQWVIEQRLEAL